MRFSGFIVQEAATLVDQADRDRQVLSETLAAALAAVSELKALLGQIFAAHSAEDIQRACGEAVLACETEVVCRVKSPISWERSARKSTSETPPP